MLKPKRQAKLLLFALAVGCAFFIFSRPASADVVFDKNKLAEDAAFINTNSMSESDIQSFLSGKGSCLASYSAPEPFDDASFSGSVSAARVIKKSAAIWGLNPQVILVTLQKEEGLILGPASYCDNGGTRINVAMGYACPDSGNCPTDQKYWGFSRQVYFGSALLAYSFHRSDGELDWNNDPNYFYSGFMTPGCWRRSASQSSCTSYSGDYTLDGCSVHMTNRATASLYRYTPHTRDPGSGCNYNGNYNFVYYFDKWFVPYDWGVVSQTVDDGSTYNGNFAITAGEVKTMTLTVQNNGSVTWNNSTNPVRLATFNPTNRTSQFADSSWVSSTRPATLQQSTVAPGDTGTFVFALHAPAAPGTYREYFNLVADGASWFQDINYYLLINVSPADYRWQLKSQSVDGSPYSGSITMNQGESKTLTVTTTNLGNSTWRNTGSPVRLATFNPTNRSSTFYDTSWTMPVRPATLTQSSVATSGTGTFTFKIAAAQPGTYREYFNLVADGVTWMPDQGLNFLINVNPITYTGQLASRSVGANPYSGMITMTAGDTQDLTVTVVNTGNATWTNSGSFPVRLGTFNPTNHSSSFQDSSWILPVRPALLQESSVAHNATGTFKFIIRASQAGTFQENFNLVAEGLTWFPDVGISFAIKVNQPDLSWQVASQTVKIGEGAETPTAALDLITGGTATLKLIATNTGSITWTKAGTYPLRLATFNPTNRSSAFATASWYSPIRPAGLQEDSVAPTHTGTFIFTVQAPTTVGTYNEYFNLVAEGFAWLNDPGMKFTITVHGTYLYSIDSQSYALNSQPAVNGSSLSLPAGSSATLTVVAKNNGTATWSNSSFPIRLGTFNPTDRASVFYTPSWVASTRPSLLTQSSVAPGAKGTFSFLIKAPSTTGTYHEYFNLVADGLTWFNDSSLHFDITVS